MPLIRIPTTAGSAPRAENDAGFGVRRGQFDDQRKAAIKASISQALVGALNTAAGLKRHSDIKEAKRAGEEVAGFEADAQALILSARVAAEETAGEHAFNPDAFDKQGAGIRETVAQNLQTMAEGLETEEAQKAAQFFLDKQLPLQLQELDKVALDEIKETERDILSARLISGTDKARALGILTPLEELLPSLTAGPTPLAHMELSETEVAKLRSSHVYNPALTIVGDALNDPARRERMVIDVLSGSKDLVLGPMKWRARSGALQAGRDMLDFAGMSAANSVELSPMDDPSLALRDMLVRAEEDLKVATAVYEPHELSGWKANVARMQSEIDRVDKASGEASALLVGDAPAGYDPLSPGGKLASTIGFRQMVSSPGFKGADIENKAMNIAVFVARAGNTPADLGPFIQSLMMNLTNDQSGESNAMLAALSLSFEALGVNVLDHGIQDAILNLDNFTGQDELTLATGVADGSDPPGTAGAVAFAKRIAAGGRQSLDRMVRQLNEGDLESAGNVFAFGRDRRALKAADAQISMMALDKTVQKSVDAHFGSGAFKAARDSDTRGQMRVFDKLVRFEAKAAEARGARIRTERRELESQLASFARPRLTGQALRTEIERIRFDPVPVERINQDIVRASGLEVAQRSARSTMIKEVALGQLLSTEMLQEMAMRGELGTTQEEKDSGLEIAKRLNSHALTKAEPRGWDPTNMTDYDKNDLMFRASDIWDDLLAFYPALVTNGHNLDAGMSIMVQREAKGRSVSSFHRGGTIEDAPERQRPDAFAVWQNEFLPGGRLEGWKKDVIVDNQTSILASDDGRGWKLVITDPDTGITSDLRERPDDPSSPVYRLELDDDNYLRMQSLHSAGDPVKVMTVTIKELAQREIIKKQNSWGDTGFEELWGDLGPRGMIEFWEEQDGMAFPLIGAQSFPRHLVHHRDVTAPDPTSPYPDSADLDAIDGATPPVDLLDGLFSTEEKFGFGSVNMEQAGKLDTWLRNYPAAIESKRARREADLMERVRLGKLDGEEARFDLTKINRGAKSLTEEIEQSARMLGPMSKWFNQAEAVGLGDFTRDAETAVTIYKNWRAMNLTGQWMAWRNWKGIGGARIKPAEIEGQLLNWVEGGGLKEWMDLPFELRRRYE